MQLVRRYRTPALSCALAVLVCELIARPYAAMGICDDGPYILMARHLAATGHIVYNGWAAPMLGWQLYLGAAFIKLFGFSYTAVRFSTVLVAMVMAFIIQRILVRAGITDRNATLGTLSFVLSPLYLMLSATYMTDVFGLFAVVLCLYGCLRALQSSSDRSAILWLCFAVLTNALCGSSRQIAWLGILVMVPSTLWLLRSKRSVLFAGIAANLAGTTFIFACMHWLAQQPYSVPEHLLPRTFPIAKTLVELSTAVLEVPFLLLPIMALFLPEIRKSSRRVIGVTYTLLLGYLLLARHPDHLHHVSLLEPTNSNWVGVYGVQWSLGLQGSAPIFLHPGMRIALTAISFGGLIGLTASCLRTHRLPLVAADTTSVSWKQLGALLAPFTLAYTLLLIPRATGWLYDRYLLALLVVALLCLVRYYQDRIQPRLPLASLLLVAIMAIYGVTVTHNLFALCRARVALAAELRASGIPDTSVDNGWEYNFDVELQQSPSINFPTITIPAHSYTPVPEPQPGACHALWYDNIPHIHPLYGISFDPNACAGPAPFAPVHYSRWPYRTPGTLYVVRYTAPSKP